MYRNMYVLIMYADRITGFVARKVIFKHELLLKVFVNLSYQQLYAYYDN